MVRKFAAIACIVCCVIAGVHSSENKAVDKKVPARRGLFVTVLQEPRVLAGLEEINRLVGFAKSSRVKVLFIQIYQANRAWFPSKVADPAPYEACVKSAGADPLALLIARAHGEGIEVHAWLNMLSLGDNKDARLLKRYGTSILTKNLKKKRTIKDYLIDDQYFLEPGDGRVREALSAVVGEVLSAYPGLDGVAFDYIRYPDKNPSYGYTTANIESFQKATGLKTVEENSREWKDWKREQVTALVGLLSKKARALRPGIKVSATGCMPYPRAYYEAFQDWPSWIERGLVDFVTAMNYSPDPVEFERWISMAKSKAGGLAKVYIGIGAYKLTRSPGVFAREFRFCESSGASAIAIFHYGSVLQCPALGNFLVNEAESAPAVKEE